MWDELVDAQEPNCRSSFNVKVNSFLSLVALLERCFAGNSCVNFREVPPKVEYSLTERGVELANVLRPLCKWGRENFPQVL